jgi:hypothetical protein
MELTNSLMFSASAEFTAAKLVSLDRKLNPTFVEYNEVLAWDVGQRPNHRPLINVVHGYVLWITNCPPEPGNRFCDEGQWGGKIHRQLLVNNLNPNLISHLFSTNISR